MDEKELDGFTGECHTIRLNVYAEATLPDDGKIVLPSGTIIRVPVNLHETREQMAEADLSKENRRLRCALMLVDSQEIPDEYRKGQHGCDAAAYNADFARAVLDGSWRFDDRDDDAR